ncbi:elongation factor G [Novispirillum itersonii]|uniref:elongation factor G n=1 Tax=Novispirillum itersonii TaxID=189 RepID=UPI000376D526|nr:elongation factor G [Novispirillum itersonii]
MGGHVSVTTPRVAAIVGPYTSGKTSLLESLLTASGTLHRRGKVTEGTSFGDAGPEARARQMTVEVTVAPATFMGEEWIFLDCPGSVEFQQQTYDALLVADIAIVVCEPDPARAVMLTPLLKFLDTHRIPHLIFINKVDRDGTNISIRACLEALQLVSDRPLLLREVPIRDGSQIVGYVDLVSERAYRYRPGEASDLIRLPESVAQREVEARQELLEHLADFDDKLLEDLLSDVTPPKEEVYDDLARDLKKDLLVPVFFGAADKDEGVRRLWKALRHEGPDYTATAARLGITGTAMQVTVFRTLHGQHTGSLYLSRVWSGTVKDGQVVSSFAGRLGKVSGLYRMNGLEPQKETAAGPGAVVALGRLEGAQTGMLIGGTDRAGLWPEPLPPLFALAVHPTRQGDDVKLTAALTRLCEEDASLSVSHDPDSGEISLWGQGDIHLAVALSRLTRVFHIEVETATPQVPYRETLCKSTKVQGRFKRQSGGHGQFGDVWLEITPLKRGDGVRFSESISGGVIPRSYIPAVEAGVMDWARRGPLGFPVVDFSVDLYDGSYHVVDSSEAAFKTAAAVGMRAGVAECGSLLLEPVLMVEVSVPTEATSRAQRALSSRRGQILGFAPREGWTGWDVVQAYLPQAEMHDLIVDIRSISMGVGTFAWRFDHMQDLVGKPAEQVVSIRQKVLEMA